MTTPAAEYTPTTAEVRNCHAYSRKMNGVPIHDEELAARFDRWLDTTIRQAKAEALREAAAAVNGEIDGEPLLKALIKINPSAEHMREFWAESLTARASRIEAGE